MVDSNSAAAATLPVDAIRDAFQAAIETTPVVLSSPTGSGKSTQVPRWCAGRVLVIEPRRVACRSLAQRVAELEATPLGQQVGYQVRDERRANASTRILFATPGIVLRQLDHIDRYDTVIIDELHERGLDTDLLVALMLEQLRDRRFSGRLVAMSATLDGDRVAEHLGGVHLHAPGRAHTVDIRHLPQQTLLPDIRGLEARIGAALDAAEDVPGDVLIFLPGKGEIASVAKALAPRPGLDLLPLHGGLSLDDQARVFRPPRGRKVILATNVAETSLTVPGIGVVIDSGLVRRTRYVRGRGVLTLAAIALDSADQRAGRAGRTGPGVAFRLWDPAAQLAARTPPEIHRESLVPLVLAAAAHGANPSTLPWLDAPKAHALATARDELEALGAFRGPTLTARGRRLFGLPLDADLGRWLVEAEARADADPAHVDGLLDMIDLVAALATDRPPMRRADIPPGTAITAHDQCDAVAMIRALRAETQADSTRSQREARSTRRRLRQAFGVEDRPPIPPTAPIDRRRLADTLLAADPRLAHIARPRGRRLGWSNGGTEVELGRETGIRSFDDEGSTPDAVLVLQTLALGSARDVRLVAPRVLPVPLSWLADAGLGRERLADLSLQTEVAIGHAAEPSARRAVATIERVFAKRVIASREAVPQGDLARDAVAELYLRGSLFGAAERDRSQRALDALRLAHRLATTDGNAIWQAEIQPLCAAEPPPFEQWIRARIEALGVESGDDVALLDATDLRPPSLPAHLRAELDQAWPRELKVDGIVYRVDYELEQSTVVLRPIRGKPQRLPNRFFLPRFAGFRVQVEHKGTLRTLTG